MKQQADAQEQYCMPNQNNHVIEYHCDIHDLKST
jgi:hypothetical protein